MDDPFISCPYEKSHRVPRSRIQAHLIRCKEKKPDYAICPYNATHRLPENQMKEHVLDCPSKKAMFPDQLKTKTVIVKPENIKLKKIPSDEEMWDD